MVIVFWNVVVFWIASGFALAMTGEGVAMTREEVAMTGEGVAMTGEGVAMIGDGVAMTGGHLAGVEADADGGRLFEGTLECLIFVAKQRFHSYDELFGKHFFYCKNKKYN
jgi:hypothetical protein